MNTDCIGRLGLLSLVIGFTLLIFISSKSNDIFFKTCEYTLLAKNSGAHTYKSNYYPDYYFTVQYTDEPNTKWTFAVGGAEYFSKDVGNNYLCRMENEYHWMGVLGMVVMMLLGCILCGVFMSKTFN